MASNRNIGIGKIYYGEVYLYYPLKVLNKGSLKEINKSLLSNKLIVTDEYLNQMHDHLHQLEKKSIKYILENGDSFPGMEFSTNENLEIDSDKSDFKCFSDYSLHLTQTQEESLILTINSLEEDAILGSAFDLDRSEENEKSEYGDIYVNSFGRFLIRPAKLQMNNDEISWMRTYLYLYTNKTAIIKINFPLMNCDADGMKKNNLDNYFKKIITYDGKEFDQCIDYICYLKSELFNGYDHMLDKQLYYINLLDFEGRPDDIKKINNHLIKDLYLIACAPVPEINAESCLTEANKHLKDNSFYLSQGLDVIKTVGGCLHIETKKSVNYYLENYFDVDVNKNDALHIICNDLCTSTEFTINIILLKRISITSAIYNLTNDNTYLFSAKEEYNKDKLFINCIQGNCYGSVVSQLKSFEKMLSLYTQEELLNERLKIMNDSLNQDELNRKEKFNSLLSAITFFFTMVFGLPAINESLSIIKQCLFNYDFIPYISLNQLSLIVWSILVIFCAVKTKIVQQIKEMFK